MKPHVGEVMRYTTNGLVATGVHYLVLYTCVELLNFSLVGLANFLASVVGILVSFAGNKYYVFKSTGKPTKSQLLRFIFLYAAIALIHGAFLYLWSDVLNKNFNIGFIIVVVIQFSLGYFSSKFLIFKKLYQEAKG